MNYLWSRTSCEQRHNRPTVTEQMARVKRGAKRTFEMSSLAPKGNLATTNEDEAGKPGSIETLKIMELKVTLMERRRSNEAVFKQGVLFAAQRIMVTR